MNSFTILDGFSLLGRCFLFSFFLFISFYFFLGIDIISNRQTTIRHPGIKLPHRGDGGHGWWGGRRKGRVTVVGFCAVTVVA